MTLKVSGRGAFGLAVYPARALAKMTKGLLQHLSASAPRASRVGTTVDRLRGNQALVRVAPFRR